MSFNDFKEKILSNGKSYSQYTIETVEYINSTNSVQLSVDEKELFEYIKLNLQRSTRIDKSFVPSEDLKDAMAGVTDKQTWMVITENWCGDSAQVLPVIAKAALLNENIDLIILNRDKNLDIIDLYLTNGTRSIPVLVAFDTEGNELFKWGPRPQPAVELIKQLKSKGVEKKEMYENLHLWYGRNRGVEIDKELTVMINSIMKTVSL